MVTVGWVLNGTRFTKPLAGVVSTSWVAAPAFSVTA